MLTGKLRHQNEKKRQGRPLGVVTTAVLLLLSERPLSARQLALELRCAIPIMEKTCHRLRSSGRIEIVGYMRVRGSNRPVAIYGLVSRKEVASIDIALHSRGGYD